MKDNNIKISKPTNWYRVPLNKEQLKSLNARDNVKGGIQTAGPLLIMGFTGILACASVQLLSWPFWILTALLHGTVTKFTSNAIHELVHGTVFKSGWTNSFFCQLFAFIGWHNHHAFWASHSKHHKNTLHSPHDQEVVLSPPQHFTAKDFLRKGFLNIHTMIDIISKHFQIGIGYFKGEWLQITVDALKEADKKKVIGWSRLLLLGHVGLSVMFLISGYWYLIIFVSLTPAYGSWLFYLINNTQHTGLMDNTKDFRLCCRTIDLNPFFRFLYWQMNYHTAHHMYPGVPCYRLSDLHKAIEHDLPSKTSGIWETWRQIITIQNRQLQEPDYQFAQMLPETEILHGMTPRK